MNTKEKIMVVALDIFSHSGYDGLGMRRLAKEAGVSLSVIYHHFRDKDELLEEIYSSTNTMLGRARAALERPDSVHGRFSQIVDFQFEHAAGICFAQKYFLHFRESFSRNERGFVPEKGYLHIEEILEYAKARGELREIDIRREAKIITHAINGFVMEYYPDVPEGEERSKLAGSIVSFIMRSVARPAAKG